MKDYDNAIAWLRKSVETLPTVWYNRAYLLSAFALTGRREQPAARAALSDYNGSFSPNTVQRITDLYEKELPHSDPSVQASIQELYRGLRTRRCPE